ncbi:MAG: hypothetical protein FWD69_11115 [Polyangiaceae bacterium]|nr:hypothetical protein [Polyangiaceae bacterium]
MHMKRALECILVVVVFIVIVPRARAAENDAGEASADALYEEAERADAAFDFARALTAYDEVCTRNPSSDRAPLAEARAAVLRDHAEGDFGPFKELERVRRDPKLSQLDRLVARAETYPPGLVRVEVWLLAAEAYAQRFDRPDDAMKLDRRILEDPMAPRLATQTAARNLTALLTARGEMSAAVDEARRAGDRADPNLLRDLTRLRRRLLIHRASLATIAAMVVFAIGAIATAARPGRSIACALGKTTPLILGYAAFVGIAGGLLASRYETSETGNATPFLLFGVALAAVLFVARVWAAAGSPRMPARAARAVVCAGATIGAAFLVLEHVDVTYLEGLGL